MYRATFVFLFALALAGAPLPGICTGGPTTCSATLTETNSPPNRIAIRISSVFDSLGPSSGYFEYSGLILTQGSMRPGWVLLTMATDGDYAGGVGTLGKTTFDGFSCMGGAQVLNLCYNNSPQPTTLGVLQPFSLTATSTRFTPASSIPGGGYRIVDLRTEFFEDNAGAPGAPVSASVVPEAASAWLAGVPLLMTAWLARRSRRLR